MQVTSTNAGNDGPPLRTRLRHWFHGEPGRSLLLAERQRLREILPDLFGYHIVQLGRIDGADLLESSRICHRVVVDTEGCAESAAQLACSAAALPFGADSIDVFVLPHVLEFEEDPYRVLREIERALIAEGHVVIIGFNPWSLWGLWRLALAWRGEPPWCGRFFGLPRTKDWLRLLGFDIVRSECAWFRPPVRSRAVLERLLFLDKLGGYWWPVLGGVYVLVGKKRLVPMTPLRARWKTRRRLIASGLAEPTARGELRTRCGTR